MPRRPPPTTVADRLTALLELPAAPEGALDPAPGDRPDGGWVPSAPDPEFDPDPDPDVDVDDDDDDDEWGGGGASTGGDAPPGAARGGRHRAPATGPRLVTVPVSLDRARAAVSWPAAVGVVALLVVAIAVFAVRVGAARAAGQPRPADLTESTQLTRTATPTGFPPAGAASSTTVGQHSPASSASTPGDVVVATSTHVVVDVAGLVLRPGVRSLAGGARVTDALAAAGGPRPGADLTRLNLARVLVDGERLYVPAPGQEPPPLLGPVAPGGGGGAGSGGGGSGGGGAGSPPTGASGPVGLNTADLGALDGLPGVGPVLAQRILDWRTAHGRFSSVDELGEVSGIGDKVLATLRPLVTL